MPKAIIYNQDSGIISVIALAQAAMNERGVVGVAVRCVPAGKPFKIVDTADLPKAPQEAWVVDDADLTDGIGGKSNEFDQD